MPLIIAIKPPITRFPVTPEQNHHRRKPVIFTAGRVEQRRSSHPEHTTTVVFSERIDPYHPPELEMMHH